MLELIGANWPVFLVALLIGIATAWWVWARYSLEADVETPKIAPSAPKVVADLAKEMPAATEPVALMDSAVVVPKAKAAPKPKAKAAPKPKADTVPKAKAAPKVKVEAAPKAKTAAVKTAAAPKAVAKPKTAAKPKAAPKPIIPDNLALLKGVGPKLNTLLKSLGVTSFEQVANWSTADIADIDSRLGTFAGRIGRDNWVDQAKLLVAGDVKGFEKKYGALGSEIQKG
jgi:predicted flap endonuclease-1-like 5' DNA nuclease